MESFMATWMREEIGNNVDPLQFENRRHVSTTHMLISLVHNWSKALDGGNIANAIFISFTKAFNKINHNILIDKYENEQINKSWSPTREPFYKTFLDQN